VKPLYIEAVGAITAGGHDAPRTVASLRSGLDRFREMRFTGFSQQDLQAAPVLGFAEGLGGVRRYDALASKAILPCLEGLTTEDRRRTAVVVGLPHPDRTGVPQGLGPALVESLAERTGLHPTAIRTVSLGRVSVFRSLGNARQVLEENDLRACVIGGVDTLVNGDSLRGLSEAGVLKEEWDGFIPGEAAAFVRVVRRPGIGAWGGDAVAVSGIGSAKDEADGTAENPLTGEGVRQAFDAAMSDAGLPESEIHLCINDLNGSRAAFEDEAMGWTRFFRTPRECLDVWHPASFLGETGASVGAIELIWASAALELGFAPGSGILASTSDRDLRAAVFLRAEEERSTGSPERTWRVGKGSPAIHLGDPPESETTLSDPGVHLGEIDDLHRDLTRENLEEVSWLWTVRESHHREDADPWLDIEEFEYRLVAHLDAAAWSSGRGRDLARDFLRSEDLDDAAAAAMLLLCFPADQEARDLLQEAMEESEERCRAIARVLPHMPRDHAEPLLRSLVSSETSWKTECGVRGLTVGGWTDENALAPVVQRWPSGLAGSLVEAAGAGAHGRMWTPYEHLLAEHIEELAPEDLFASIALSPRGIVIPGAEPGRVLSRAPVAYALWCLRENASFPNAFDDERSISPDVIDAIGWAGETASQSILLDILDVGEPDQQAPAALALSRIYGVRPMETVEVPLSEEEGEGEEEQGAAPETATRAEGSEPLETIEEERLSRDPEVWDRAIQKIRVGEDRHARLRHGRPWRRDAALTHLQREECTYSERLAAAWEFAIVNRARLPVHPCRFVEPQKRAVARLMAEVAESSR
jgi:3-oxoacyl-[acyl-carrier-protein] synthase-1